MRISHFPFFASALVLGSASFVLADSAVEQSWQDWDSLPDAEKIDIAPYCPGGFVLIPLQKMPEQKTQFWFDQARTNSENQTEFMGNVHIIGDQINTQSDYARYEDATDTAILTGNVSVLLPEALLSGNNALVYPDQDYAHLKDSQFVLADRDIHGTADEMQRQNESILVARDMEFTRCAPSVNQWSISSSELTIDNEQHIAKAWHSTLNIKGVPVMYVPYISFPLNDQPMSGFLTPTFSSGFTIPYYFHLAPNYDDTVAVSYSTDLGVIIQNQFRFLTKEHNGTNAFSYQLTDVESGEIRRWSVSHNQSGVLAGVGYNFTTAWVSDTNADIAFNPGSSDEIDFQTANLTLNKKLGSFNNSLTLKYLQPVVDGDEEMESVTTTFKTSRSNTSLTVLTKTETEYRPDETNAGLSDYDYLPQPKVTLAHKSNSLPFGITSAEQLQYGYFEKNLPDDLIENLSASTAYHATQTSRYHGSLKLSRPTKGNNWSITPTWTGLATQYQLQNPYDDFDWDNSKYESTEMSQFAWRANIDAKATFTQKVVNNDKYLVKPRLYYGYAPLFKDQTSPIVEGDFVDTFNLFTDSRFSSIDRTADMSRLSGSLGYEWQRNNKTKALFTVAKGIKLAQERLLESGYGSVVNEVDDDWEREYSDWIGSTKLQFTEALSFTGSVSYSHDWNTAEEYSAVLRYRPGDRSVFTLSGIKEDTEETNSDGDDVDGYSHEFMAGAYLPVYENIALMSYANFSAFTTDSQVGTDEDFDWNNLALEQVLFGVDFDACCWNLRLAMLSVNEDAFDTADSLFPVSTKQTYYFEFTLKGLGGGTGSIESILNRLDFGYSGKIFNYR